jgi:hypothetical protein
VRRGGLDGLRRFLGGLRLCPRNAGGSPNSGTGWRRQAFVGQLRGEKSPAQGGPGTGQTGALRAGGIDQARSSSPTLPASPASNGAAPRISTEGRQPLSIPKGHRAVGGPLPVLPRLPPLCNLHRDTQRRSSTLAVRSEPAEGRLRPRSESSSRSRRADPRGWPAASFVDTAPLSQCDLRHAVLRCYELKELPFRLHRIIHISSGFIRGVPV